MDGHKLVQIRNPWANEVEWNGPWSDTSSEWTDRMRHKLKHVPQVVAFFSVWHELLDNCIYLKLVIFEYISFLCDLCDPFFNSQKMVYSGCLGKIFKFTSDQFMYVGSTLLRCAILSMDNGVVTVLVAVKIIIRGIKIPSSD